MVDLQAFSYVAARDGAFRITSLQSRPELCGNGTAGMGHGLDVASVGNKNFQDRVA
jgi:hypothetical protein